jgi:hypothetical protein
MVGGWCQNGFRNISWAVVKTVTNLRDSYNAARNLISWRTVSFARRTSLWGSWSQFYQQCLLILWTSEQRDGWQPLEGFQELFINRKGWKKDTLLLRGVLSAALGCKVVRCCSAQVRRFWAVFVTPGVDCRRNELWCWRQDTKVNWIAC